MNEEQKPVEKPIPKKKSIVSIPFIIIGLLLIGLIVPVFNLVPDEPDKVKKDSIAQYLMFKMMASEEGAKASGAAIKGAAADGPQTDQAEAKMDKRPEQEK